MNKQYDYSSQVVDKMMTLEFLVYQYQKPKAKFPLSKKNKKKTKKQKKKTTKNV